jgi:putative ABC transport system permease protein
LILLMVTTAVAVAALTFAEVLDRTLASSRTEKAYVANGSDVQGVIDPLGRLPAPLPFPAARVTEDFLSARVDGSQRSLELMAVHPAQLARVVDRPELARLAASGAPLPAIANGAARNARAIWFGGRRVPVRVVAVVRSFPGMVAGEDFLVVPAPKLQRAVASPYAIATGYVWVRGDSGAIARALARAEPAPIFVTTVNEFLRRADSSTASRTYGFLRVVALGAAAVALSALLLYLHARARTQLVTMELLERMGMARGRQSVAVALEAAIVVLLAGLVGTACALLAAASLATRLDPLPQYAPAVTLDVPWLALAASLLGLVLLGAIAGAVSALAARGDLAEAVRVA